MAATVNQTQRHNINIQIGYIIIVAVVMYLFSLLLLLYFEVSGIHTVDRHNITPRTMECLRNRLGVV